MAKIFTDCLVTGQPIDTGIEIDEASFARLPPFVGKIFCPHCGSRTRLVEGQRPVVDGDKPKSLTQFRQADRGRDGEREVNQSARIQSIRGDSPSPGYQNFILQFKPIFSRRLYGPVHRRENRARRT